MSGTRDPYPHPILFQAFPELKGRIPWVSLGRFPTPVQPLQKIGPGGLWIKRDDLSSPVYGGNKVRKLEFALAEARVRGKRRVVTMGALGTHHGLATAVFSRQLGMDCTLLLFPQPETPAVRQNVALFARCGARVLRMKSLWRTVVAYYLTHRLRAPRAYYLFAGGSNAAGTVGFVNAALELKWQIDQGLCPEPRRIFCASGSNGTLAGLALGAALAGIQAQVVGVRVANSHLGPFPTCTPKTVRLLMEKTYRRLRDHSREIPRVAVSDPILLEDYLGKGYASPTREGRKAQNLLWEKEGIALDPTYTAKTFAAVLDHWKKSPEGGGPLLYWHTLNSADLSPLLNST
jgi:D-cysteine desulfhydrase